MNKPTHEELYDVLVSVYRKTDNSWRHGCYVFQVFKRPNDNTYWGASYRLSADGKTNELRDGECNIFQVTPKETTTITYEELK